MYWSSFSIWLSMYFNYSFCFCQYRNLILYYIQVLMVYLSTYIYRYVVLHVLLSSCTCIMYSTYIVFILVNITYIRWKEQKQISWTPNIKKITHLKLFLITIKEGTSDRPHIIYVSIFSILNYSLSFLVTFSIIKKTRTQYCIN